MKNKNTTTGRTQKPLRSATQQNAQKKYHSLPIIPVLPILFVLTYLWAAWYFGDVLRMARERSFWVPSTEEMEFLLQQNFGWGWSLGRLLIMPMRYPWAGALIPAVLITLGTWLTGYVLRLKGNLRFLEYIPAGLYFSWMTYEGINWFHENEKGMIFAVPFFVVLLLAVCAIAVAFITRGSAVPALVRKPKDETSMQNWLQVGMLVLIFGGCALFDHFQRPYTRVMAREDVCMLNQDWQGIMKVARDNATLSYRPIAAKYAIALVETNQICERLYDIRLDYDSLYLHSQNGKHCMELNMYQEDCDYYAGFMETCIHHAIERNTMIGPNIRSLELLTKCAIMRKEWENAYRYLRILRDVPFEGSFVDKYTKYVGDTAVIKNDPEMALIMELEPIHDSFENNYQQPTFLGYNLALMEGRSKNALMNSLAVCMYTKLMPAFMMRTAPLQGSTPPENIADALCLMTAKDASIPSRFAGLEYRMSQLQSSLTAMKPYLSDRPGNARMLFDTYKGYYPYYYFFGNLKATKKRNTDASSSAGVN